MPSALAHPETRPRFPGKVPGEVGIWIFILGEMVLYALLFGSFLGARAKHPAIFAASEGTLDKTTGAINMLLLLTGSLFVALGVRAIREGIGSRPRRLFLAALVCGVGFVFNKYVEYSSLLSAHHTPTKNSFYTYYYVLTGIHLTHALAGLAVLLFLWRVAGKEKIETNDISAIECGGSWWHLVDLLWVVLFPLLYLVN